MTVLDDILEGVREDLAARQAEVTLGDLKRDAHRMPDAKDPMPAFRGDGISAVIAEVKRSSPSKGELAEINDPAALAVEYCGGGAAAISVLTEQRRFNGTLTTCARSAAGSTYRCCARTSSCRRTSCGRRVPRVPTWRC